MVPLKSHHNMEKEGRKHSDDPKQEQLRSAKDNWNSATKEFIKRIIAFKRALNGRGDNVYNLPPSSIKDPLPQEIVSFLSELTANFSELANAASHIFQEQAEYSHTRRQPQKIATASKKTGKVLIGDHIFDTELAITSTEQEKGLMFEKEPKIMSFPYASPMINRFWMKATPCPLDIIFSLDGTITNICRGEPFSTQVIGDYSFSDLVVELPAETAKNKNIKIGDPIKLL